MWRDASSTFDLTLHARSRLAERGIPTCLVRLAIDRGTLIRDRHRDRFVLGVRQMDAAGFGPSRYALAVVARGRKIVTVMWLDGSARVCA